MPDIGDDERKAEMRFRPTDGTELPTYIAAGALIGTGAALLVAFLA